MGRIRLPSPGAVLRGLKAEAAAQGGSGVPVGAGRFRPGRGGLSGAEGRAAESWPAAGRRRRRHGVALAFAVRRWMANRWAGLAASFLALAACGFAAGKLHADLAAGPVAPAHMGMVGIEGWVVDVAKPSQTEFAPPDRADVDRRAAAFARAGPRLVRLVVPPDGDFGDRDRRSVSDPCSIRRRVRPRPGPMTSPVTPGSKVSAGVGLAKLPPSIIDLVAPPAWPLRWRMAINAARWSLAQRLAADVSAVMGPHDDGAVGLVVTVATSHEDWLDDASRDDLRGSGLAHMLAIAGLHTAAVSGFVFFALRLGVAAWPWLALRVNGKKVAAGGGLVAVAIYLALSGAHPPAIRAATTASVAFVAMLAGRRAISLHSWRSPPWPSWSLQPAEDVVQPGFQMSFCATAALIALAEGVAQAQSEADRPTVAAGGTAAAQA